MRTFSIVLDRFEQTLLTQILTELIDKNNPFQLESITEQACAVNEAERLIRKMVFLVSKIRFKLHYHQVTIVWKILYCYPTTGLQQLNAVRMLLLHFDKHYQTIQIHLNYDVQNKTYESAANMLADRNYGSNA